MTVNRMAFGRHCGKQAVIFAGFCHVGRKRGRWALRSVFLQSSVALAIGACRPLDHASRSRVQRERDIPFAHGMIEDGGQEIEPLDDCRSGQILP
ncbi:hypothetical protein AD943_04440 [Gluconobacter roseus]|nr:hypothetical protein AD943_04440 [Gluconobacter roseus]